MRLYYMGFALVGMFLSCYGQTNELSDNLTPPQDQVRRLTPEPKLVLLSSVTVVGGVPQSLTQEEAYFCDLVRFCEDTKTLSHLLETLTADFDPKTHNLERFNTTAATISAMPDFDKKYSLLKHFMVRGRDGSSMGITTKMNDKKNKALALFQALLSDQLAMDPIKDSLVRGKADGETLRTSVKALLEVIDEEYSTCRKKISWAEGLDPAGILTKVNERQDVSAKASVSPKSPRSMVRFLSGLLKGKHS
jgi:hypothetical protein